MSAGTISQAQNLLFWNDGSIQWAAVSKSSYTANYFLFWNDGAVAGTFAPAKNSSGNFFFFIPV